MRARGGCEETDPNLRCGPCSLGEDVWEVVLAHSAVLAVCRLACVCRCLAAPCARRRDALRRELTDRYRLQQRRYSLRELHRYHTRIFLFRVATAAAPALCAPIKFWHGLDSSFTLQLLASPRGDVTLIDVPGMLELCHGYPTESDWMPALRVCLMLRSDKHKQLHYRLPVRSDGSLHAYTLHVRRQEAHLTVDALPTLRVRHDFCPRDVFRSICVGSDSDGDFACASCVLEGRLVNEPRVSAVTRDVHVRGARLATSALPFRRIVMRQLA